MTIEEFLPYFPGAKRQGSGYIARCPAHDDRTASLSIAQGDKGIILLHCHAGCSSEEIMGAKGLSMKDLYPDKAKERTTAAVYDYVDAAGKLLFQKVRYTPKGFALRRPDNSGGWIYKEATKGLSLVPFNLPALLKSDAVFICEGEKDCLTMQGMGKVATTSPFGGGKGKNKWPEHFNEWFRGKQVYIIPDNDPPGREYAEIVARGIKPFAKLVKVLDLTQAVPDLKEKGDISDVAERFGSNKTISLLDRLIGSAQEWEPTLVQPVENHGHLCIVSAAELQEQDIPPLKYAVVDMIPAGLSILASPPKYGKSWFVLDMCLSVAAGRDFQGHRTVKSECLYLALEDGHRRLKDRMNRILDGAPAPVGFYFAITAGDIANGLIDELTHHIKERPDTGLIVIDTLQKVRPHTSGKESAYMTDYNDVGAIKTFADKHGVAVLLVHHLRKAADDADPFNRISGTSGLTGAADTMLVLMKEKRDSERATLSIVGRDIESSDTVLTFDTERCVWRVIGDAAQVAEQQAHEEYESNPIVLTARKLLEQIPAGWSGTAQELLNNGMFIAHTYLAPNARALTEKLKALERPLYEFDGIIHERTKHGNAGGKHKLYRYSCDPFEQEPQQHTLNPPTE